MTSSNDDAAITKVGIPCSTPKPLCCKVRSWGTTTAGVTAPRTNLKRKGIHNQQTINLHEIPQHELSGHPSEVYLIFC